MAKHLKLNIKNAQLAEALNLNKKAKPKEKKNSGKKTVESADHLPTEEPLEKTKIVKKIKAQDLPEHMRTSSPKKKIKATDLPSSEAAPSEPSLEEPLPQETEEVSKQEKVSIEEPIAEIEKAKEVVEKVEDLPKEEIKSQETDLSKEKKEAGETPSHESKKTDVKPAKLDKEEKPAKKFKDVKVQKKFEQKSFDARDRQGLRDSEDGSWRRRRPKYKQKALESNIPIVRPTKLSIKLPIMVKDLAIAMKRKASEIITKLFMQGLTLTLNDYLDDETIVQLIGAELDCDITIDTSEQKRLQITSKTIAEEIAETSSEKLTPRPPVIAFMGHVDHGKTSLIDALRKSNLTAQEAGAITQHIGAFQCHTPNGNITILDTPGHEAFKEMRMRGANVTDIVILVIAGDEGMMPQTKEAIKHAKDANVPIIVAINKCDKPAFNAEDVYRQLADQDLLPEKWGGQIITVNCSAHTKEGISSLLEMILLQAEVLELKADTSARARGTVLESQLHRGLGSVANILVQNGTLKTGDALVFDDIYGKVKTMHNELGKHVHSAAPSTPVKITGLSGIPEAGCEFIVVDSEKEAKKICEDRTAGQKRASLRRRTPSELEGIITRSQELQQKKVLNLILRADVQGSLEALKNSLLKIPSNKVELNIISEGIGQISESDIQRAATSHAAIIGFHTQVESHAESEIAHAKITVKIHDIIYHLINDVKKLMTAQLDKIKQENEVGTAEVRTVFKSSQLGSIAGCYVTDGIIKRNHHVKIFRNDEKVFEGDIASLKRVKEDVKEVSKGLECGILLQNYNQIQEGDLIKAYEITYLEQEL